MGSCEVNSECCLTQPDDTVIPLSVTLGWLLNTVTNLLNRAYTMVLRGLLKNKKHEMCKVLS